MSHLYVVKRSGEREEVQFDKISARNRALCLDLPDVDPVLVTMKVIEGIYAGVKTSELDILSAETALFMSAYEPSYEILAKRLAISSMHKSTDSSFMKVTQKLHDLHLLHEDYWTFVRDHEQELEKIPIYERDYDYSFFGYKTLEKSYLTRDEHGILLERPQHLLLRVATFIRMPDLQAIKQVYENMSLKKYTHASPTMFNAGMKYAQMSSCFLLSSEDDLSVMFDTVKQGGLISKFSGGLGINLSMIRSKGSRIHSTGGRSDGIVPYLKVWDSLSRYVNQSGRRKGSVAIYLEPHHPDLIEFLKIRKNNTKQETQCLDLNTALWVSDLFMKRLSDAVTGKNGKTDVLWSFFDPNTVKGLHDIYGEEYTRQYLEAEREKKYVKQMRILDVWREIISVQMETGEPYIMFKDTVNHRSNQKNIGTIRGSNLCVSESTRVWAYSDKHPTPREYTMKELMNYQADQADQNHQSDVPSLWYIATGSYVDIDTTYTKTPLSVVQTGTEKFLMSIKFCVSNHVTGVDHEETLEVTPFHVFYNGDDINVEKILAYQLEPDMILCPFYNHLNEECSASVISISSIDGFHTTYCFHEPVRGRILFNGIQTGNCTEITQYTDSTTISVCNLASISLPAFVLPTGEYDFAALGKIAEEATENMNMVIDRNFYPVEEAKKSNIDMRPIGIGAQGLADVFQMMNLSWLDPKARELNQEIYAVIHYHCLKKSCELATDGNAYPKFQGSPASQGLLQPHLAGLNNNDLHRITRGRLDWEKLILSIQTHGLRNSLLTTQMPTASTAQILGNNESMEPYTTNMYVRRVLSGDFPVINQHLYRHLKKLGLWTKEIVDVIIANNGSILGITKIPEEIRHVFLTAWEIRMKYLVDMGIDRGAFIDQAQSFNVFMETPTLDALTSMFLYSWKGGMKTGMYYLRRRPKVDAVKFSLLPSLPQPRDQPRDNSENNNNDDNSMNGQVCTREEGCLSCGG